MRSRVWSACLSRPVGAVSCWVVAVTSVWFVGFVIRPSVEIWGSLLPVGNVLFFSMFRAVFACILGHIIKLFFGIFNCAECFLGPF